MRKTILCIDDDVDELRLRKAILQTKDYDVLTATNGWAGLTILKHGHIDVVVLDYAMPEMDGTATAGEIRKLSPQLPIVVLSGHDKCDLPDQLMELTDGFVAKASAPGVLFSLLERLTGADRIAA